MTSLQQAQCLSSMISLIGSDGFEQDTYDVLRSTFGIDQCTAFFRNADRTDVLVAEAESDQARSVCRALSRDYISKDFRRDPVWHGGRHGGAAEIRTFIVNPGEIDDEDYRGKFYDGCGINKEIALVACSGTFDLYLSLYRFAGGPDFSAREVDAVSGIALPIVEILRKHIELMGRSARGSQTAGISAPSISSAPNAAERKALLEHLRSVMMSEGHGLTAREAEVCASIVLGYTVIGTAMNLNITVNTVATHRKRAYSKLHICSQNELFARYFNTIHRFEH